MNPLRAIRAGSNKLRPSTNTGRASAAFKRADSLWLVFDSPIKLDLRAVASSLGALAKDEDVSRFIL